MPCCRDGHPGCGSNLRHGAVRRLGTAGAEHRNGADQLLGLYLEAVCGGGACSTSAAFCCVTVSIWFTASPIWATPRLCSATCRADFGHQVGDPADALHHLVHRGARLIDQGAALLDPLDARGDEGLDFLGCIGTALGQAAYFARDDGKAASLIAGARSFDSCIEGEDVGLERDSVDDADDLGDLAAAVVDPLHGLDDPADHFTAARGDTRSPSGDLIALLGIFRVLVHRDGQLLHGRGGLLERAGLFFRAAGQVVVARGDLGGGEAMESVLLRTEATISARRSRMFFMANIRL